MVFQWLELGFPDSEAFLSLIEQIITPKMKLIPSSNLFGASTFFSASSYAPGRHSALAMFDFAFRCLVLRDKEDEQE